MAVPNRGQIVATAWEDYAGTKPEDQVFQYNWLLENLRAGKGFRKGAGTPIAISIEYATNTTVKSMSELETLDVQRVDIFDQAEFQWKFVGGLIVMSEFEKLIQAGGAGKFELEAGKMENLKNSLSKTINEDLYSDGTGNGGKQAGGLQFLVANNPTVGSPGNIPRITYTFWRNQQLSGAKSVTAYDNYKGTMFSLYNLCSSGVGRQTPEFAVTNRTDFQGYESLLVSMERLNRTSNKDMGISGFKGDSLMLKDIPISYDGPCPAGTTYMLNRRNLFVRYLAWMKAFPPGTPVNQFIDVVKVLTLYNACTNNPRRLGVVTGVN